MKKLLFIFKITFVCCIFTMYQCTTAKKNNLDAEPNKIDPKAMTIKKNNFGETLQGIAIDEYCLKNQNGMEVSIINYGGVITSLKTPNNKGVIENVVLGFETLDEYVESSPYFGAIVGRYGNRIANGKFSLNGKEYDLAINNAPNSLHGGIIGFDKVVWRATTESNDDSVSLILVYVSDDMEEGFPGTLTTKVTYTLDATNELRILYEATTNKQTIVNLTNHSYFNLSGNFNKDVLNHELQIEADSFLPVDKFMIPTGKIEKVEGTPFDFRKPKNIGKNLDDDNEQLNIGLGYDHNWVLNKQNQGTRLIATAYDRESGRLLEVFTDEPGVQLYTGNHLDGAYAKRTGFCLETQHYPDSPNQMNFPSAVLNPGEKYSSRTSFKFSVK